LPEFWKLYKPGFQIKINNIIPQKEQEEEKSLDNPEQNRMDEDLSDWNK